MRLRPIVLILAAAVSGCTNPTESRIAGKCAAAFVDPPGERTTYDSIETVCNCFSAHTRHNEGSNYLDRMETAMESLSTRRERDRTSWPEAFVALEAEYKAAGNDTALEGLDDILSRMTSVQDDLKDGNCSEFR